MSSGEGTEIWLDLETARRFMHRESGPDDLERMQEICEDALIADGFVDPDQNPSNKTGGDDA